ncbi:MAG TPA: M56 family metallopeptidase, partial [Gemmatimonadaceae bacterium]
MSNSLSAFAALLSASASLALIVKLTLLLATAGVVTTLLHMRSAAARHYVWALALASGLALPLVTRVAPTLPVPIAARNESGVINSAGPTSIRAPVIAPVGTSGTLTSINALALDEPLTATPSGILTRVWLIGLAMVVGWLILGHVGLARLTRRAEVVLDSDWDESLDEACDDLAIRRQVRLLRSSAVGAPITWGFLRPIIVLPLAAEGWSAERRRVVLLHELAHVARQDYVVQMIAAAACAFYWFHPGVWLGARRLRYESERACDDQVLASGTASTDYAAHLLSVATGSRALRLTGGVAIGMARRSALEGRLLAALDPTLRRAPLTRRARILSTATLGIAVLPLAGMRAVERAAPAVVATSGTVDDSTFERSVRVSPGERLFLDLAPGGDVSVRGWDESRVQVRVRLAGEDWRDIAVDIGRDNDGVLVKARYDTRRNSQSSDNSFEIRVPRRFDVRLRSGGGDLTITDVEGTFEGTSGGGQITLERLRGHASLSTGGGEIHVDDVNLSGSVSTGGGRVTLSRVSGGLRGSSGSGPVMYGDRSDAGGQVRASGRNEPSADLRSVTVQPDGKRITLGSVTRADGAPTLHIEKAGGGVDLAEAPGGAVISTGGGDIRVGKSAGVVEASTGGGDITIGPVAGSVIAGTGAGTVSVTLADAGGEPQNVDIHAGVGRITVILPRDFDGTFELETAYTRNFRRATEIRSDW